MRCWLDHLVNVQSVKISGMDKVEIMIVTIETMHGKYATPVLVINDVVLNVA